MSPAPPSAAPAEEPTHIPSVVELHVGFMRIAALSFGGVLPWARFVLVEQRRWLTPDEFTEMLSLCQLLPGPNIVNMSVAIGARFHGPRGAIAAVLGLTLLPVAIVLSLAVLYAGFRDVPAVGQALDGMAAAAAGLIIAMALKMASPILRRRPWRAAPAIVLAFVAIAILRLPLFPVVLVMAPFAIALAWRGK